MQSRLPPAVFIQQPGLTFKNCNQCQQREPTNETPLRRKPRGIICYHELHMGSNAKGFRKTELRLWTTWPIVLQAGNSIFHPLSCVCGASWIQYLLLVSNQPECGWISGELAGETAKLLSFPAVANILTAFELVQISHTDCTNLRNRNYMAEQSQRTQPSSKQIRAQWYIKTRLRFLFSHIRFRITKWA